MLRQIDKLFDEGGYPVFSLLVEREGETLLRCLNGPDIRRPVYSATKSFTSTAVGMLQDEGKWSVEESLARYLPAEYLEEMEPARRAAFERLSIRRFLTMSVEGYPFRPEGEDWLRMVLRCPARLEGEPAFSYSNIPAYLVGVAAERAAGEPLGEYLKRRLLAPLGIENPTFRTDPQGRFYGATGMELTVGELSRLGRLYRQGGRWKGERLISESWTRAAVSRQIDTGKGGYGYFFWNDETGFSISGKWGQKCLVYPARGMSVSWLGNMQENPGEFERKVRKICQIGR